MPGRPEGRPQGRGQDKPGGADRQLRRQGEGGLFFAVPFPGRPAAGGTWVLGVPGELSRESCGRARPGRGVETVGQSLGKLPGSMCRGGRPEGRRSASRSQGGPCVPSTAAAGQRPLHEAWSAKAERAQAQLGRATAGVDLAGPGVAHRLPAPLVGTGGEEELETTFPFLPGKWDFPQ